MQVTKYAFQMHSDERGKLVAVEAFKDIPFEIKRVYYMYGVPENVRRGYHAHRNLEQVLICIAGSCKILLDDGKEKCVVTLDTPYEGIYISKAIWREMYEFSENAILVVLASDYYDENDYIRNYNEFINSNVSGDRI